jgi:hypothetical protein
MVPELAMLSALGLRNGAGANFDPANYAAFKSWLSSASATNMAYMLSAQLSAVSLSVESGFTNGDAQVVATSPLLASVSGMSPLGVISVSDLMAAADVSLLAYPITVSPHVARAYQEALKNALEKVATGQSVQVCDVEMTFTATDSLYYNGPTDAAPLYGTGPISFTWDPVTGNVTGGYYNEVVPPVSGTTYYNIIGGTVVGNVFTLTFTRILPSPYAFVGTLTLSGNTVTGTLDGPYYFTATGTVTP